MEVFSSPPLPISGFLEADMKQRLTAEGTDAAIAAVRFATLCSGDARHGRPPLYERTARTVWRVENAGQPPPSVCVFDWGGDAIGVPALRVWYMRLADSSLGLGAFPATDGERFPEQGVLEQRAAQALRAPGCYFE